MRFAFVHPKAPRGESLALQRLRKYLEGLPDVVGLNLALDPDDVRDHFTHYLLAATLAQLAKLVEEQSRTNKLLQALASMTADEYGAEFEEDDE